MRSALILAPLLALTACGPVDPVRAAKFCEDKARAAQGPTGSITVGVNSDSGSFVNGELAVSSDFLTRKDPLEVYESCVVARTGQAPIWPPVLR